MDLSALTSFVTSRVCGELSEGSGVGLRWPDGFVTEAVASSRDRDGERMSTSDQDHTRSRGGGRRALRSRRGGQPRPHRRATSSAPGRSGVRLLALPEACLGGYLSVAGPPAATAPTTSRPGVAAPRDGRRRARAAGGGGARPRDDRSWSACVKSDGADRFNSAAAVTGDGVLGVHRKVHQPLGESAHYARRA